MEVRRMGEESNNLCKIQRLRLVMLNIFGCFLAATAITGIQSYARYVPSYLIVILALTGASVLILSIAILIMKNPNKHK
ncbi:hypothetical protein [Clostridium sp. OS1-26]|uniref:hypothetical protein n=1 Tax=Clostridium sp. OS1-26 TaxID=3070681 RepID=UPI0027E15D0A|nr:hypothetical protein [Clostridium sp. OS1-26]WML34005.1 hypothetical protein RCG18_22215 [Clostridium sp. OS1-26]